MSVACGCYFVQFGAITGLRRVTTGRVSALGAEGSSCSDHSCHLTLTAIDGTPLGASHMPEMQKVMWLYRCVPVSTRCKGNLHGRRLRRGWTDEAA